MLMKIFSSIVFFDYHYYSYFFHHFLFFHLHHPQNQLQLQHQNQMIHVHYYHQFHFVHHYYYHYYYYYYHFQLFLPFTSRIFFSSFLSQPLFNSSKLNSFYCYKFYVNEDFLLNSILRLSLLFIFLPSLFIFSSSSPSKSTSTSASKSNDSRSLLSPVSFCSSLLLSLLLLLLFDLLVLSSVSISVSSINSIVFPSDVFVGSIKTISNGISNGASRNISIISSNSISNASLPHKSRNIYPDFNTPQRAALPSDVIFSI
mmetsp:Transcript_15010/g.15746  ORF Transcript_15010/g.15746 Transcript_15010/m.15746 type:complete len:258 (-) Transcript_15010:1693-2466(-)